MGRAEHAVAPGGAASVSVEVVYCAGRGDVDLTRLRLPAGATLADALEASGLQQRHPSLDPSKAGIWSRPAPPTQALREGDRVEFYRELRVDPMQARRERHQRRVSGRARRG